MRNEIWIWSVALILTLFTAINGWAIQSRKIVANSGAPIPTEYSYTNNQSIVFGTIAATDDLLGARSHLHINNTTSSAIACMEGDNNTTAPSSTSGQAISEEIYLPATTQYVFDGINIARRFYCRSDSGTAITSGQIIVHVY